MTKKPTAPLSRALIDDIARRLLELEQALEKERKALLAHYREGARLPSANSWLLRGWEYDVLLTRAGVVSIPSQGAVDRLPRRVRRQFFFLLHAPFDTTKELMRSAARELPARVRKLLKLSRHWRIKPERRRVAARSAAKIPTRSRRDAQSRRPARRSAQRAGVAA